ncbi:DUF305 domain-containing protein [Cellulomonas phragmiteti]|uniref:DUF305 domain-containing protein n=1 Tax=Cellulomonas phragmiteti TaxID=478780 RepID=A0ABQ4DHI0_9CELL|nr:DUF305 domain-containing protein [Cellulomonas phragmiteti]GIG38376.1 hypothetical protein Cph01nite_01380 [Cellulomonas phragmiteti]
MSDPAAGLPAAPAGARSALGQAVSSLTGTARVVVAVLVALALLVGAAAGATLVARPDAARPSDTSVDAGFARDMQAHHAQAVELAVLVRDRSDDETLRAIALDILTIQQQQIGQMAAWLRLWGLPAASPAGPMAWMTGPGHGHGSTPGTGSLESMPGWVPADAMAELRAADGVTAERLFLTLMIEHHAGGVEMARYAVEHGRHPEVLRLAQGVVDSQTREQVVLQDLLDARGGPLAG